MTRLAAAALLLAAALPAVADTAPAPCRLRGVETGVLCGSVQRPLDPARPEGPQIDVHYAVLPAVARRKKPEPVFFFAGGPGQSAIGVAGRAQALLARLGNRRDIVLVDQRGTGRSAPLSCDDEDDARRSMREAADPAQTAARIAACRQRLQALPHGDLRFYTTTIAMQDVDAVRRALGAERIDLVGGSYGTRAALEYLRQFPQAVRRVVLDGVAPPDMVLPESYAADAQAVLDALFDACAAEAACTKRHGDLRAAWRALLAGLPRETSVTHPLTGARETLVLTRDAVTGLVRAPLYSPVLASALPAALAQAAQGRWDALLALGSGLGGGREGAVAMGMHFSVVCSEDMPRAAAKPPAGDFGGGLAQLYRTVCDGWPRGAVPPAFYAVPASRAPVLLLSGGLDPATPPRHADRVARALGAAARHVVVPNAGHGVMGIGCMRDVVFRFIDGDDPAAADAACALKIPRPPAWQPLEGAP